jgi:hypothetical protein
LKQTKLVSIIEVCTNVATGFLLAMLVWLYFIPVFWPRMAGPLSESFWVTFTFTTVSIIRGYFWRRFFANGFHHALVNWMGRAAGGKKV